MYLHCTMKSQRCFPHAHSPATFHFHHTTRCPTPVIVPPFLQSQKDDVLSGNILRISLEHWESVLCLLEACMSLPNRFVEILAHGQLELPNDKHAEYDSGED